MLTVVLLMSLLKWARSMPTEGVFRESICLALQSMPFVDRVFTIWVCTLCGELPPDDTLEIDLLFL